jgi:hypothetical protein
MGSRHECCDGGGTDDPRLCFTGELLLPRLEASRRAAAARRQSCLFGQSQRLTEADDVDQQQQ